MSYQVLALKYRPQTFDDVVGQTHVTTTLSNAIRTDRVAHAILFTGPRGTGKTTIARILAKAMNCKNGPSPVPCNQCKLCTDIIEGHCSDVFEIDGASNNSVDQIRDLRENVTYMPGSAKYKIYIIDEVHMLSTAAFNALLKTLEEPPDHVMFIFATTEVHKIPATILSRCQRHDLGRISLAMIASHLQKLCEQEGFHVSGPSLDLIAREADGSIRDSLSLLDRILSASGVADIDHETILESLGILDTQIIQDISKAVFENNGGYILELVQKINDSGMDLKKFYTDLILYFRNLNVIKICGPKSNNVNLSETEKEVLFLQAEPLSAQHINAILQALLDDESLVRYASNTKTAIEMILLKLIRMHPGQHIDHIIEKLDHLAEQIAQNPGRATQAYASPQEGPVNSGLQPSADLPPVEKKIKTPELSSDTGPTAIAESVAYERNWQGFLSQIESTLPFMVALLSKGRVSEKTPDKLLVELENCSSFDKKRIQTKKKELQDACVSFLNKTLSIKVLSESNGQTQDDKKKTLKAKQAAFNHPFVVEAQKLFNGEIINY